MSEIDPLDRRALGVLSETVGEELGSGSIVAREVNRAYRSGRRADLRTASAAFDALPAWQRTTIGNDAVHKAHRIHAQAEVKRRAETRAGLRDTARDWRDLDQTRAQNKTQDRDRVVIPSPPRFLKPKATR